MQKIIKLTKNKYQVRISIPREFVKALNLEDYAIIKLHNNHLTIHPAIIEYGVEVDTKTRVGGCPTPSRVRNLSPIGGIKSE